MKRLSFILFFGLSLVYGDMESERSPTYFRDQLEVSQVAETPVIDVQKLKLEFYKQGKLYKRFFKESFEDFLKAPSGLKELEDGEEHTIVSLTSWPPRIHTVFLTIESILRQTHKPHKVLLYLSEEEFPTKELPETLKFQQTRGLEVRWVKENLKSFKKLLYALKEFPNSNIITVDDDQFYSPTLLQEFLETKAQSPNKVIAGEYAERYFFDQDRRILSFFEGMSEKNDSLNFIVRGTGIGGVFYFKNCFADLVFNAEFIKKYCRSDDIWFSTALLQNNIETIRLTHDYNRNITTSEGLETRRDLNRKKDNKKLCLYDYCTHNTFLYFDLYKKLNLFPLKNLEKYEIFDLSEKW